MTDDDNDTVFQGEHFEGLGNVWSAALGESDNITNHLPTVTQKGILKKDVTVNHAGIGRTVLLVKYPTSGPLQAGALLVEEAQSYELWSAYPILEGASNNVIIDGCHTWGNGIEGVVACHIASGPPVAFFDPYYFRESAKFVNGNAVQIDLAGLAFSLTKADSKDIQVTEGAFYKMELNRFLADNPGKKEADFIPPVVTMRGARLLFAGAYVPEYTFQCPAVNIEQCELFGTRFFRIQTVFAGVDESELRGYIYASEAILNGYEPKQGDDITGTLWMSGYVTPQSGME